MTLPSAGASLGAGSAPQHALYIGRFQPPHRAHVASALAALEHAPQLTLGLGSANLAPSIKNPWSPAEREELWRLALAEAGADPARVRFCPLADRFDAEMWAADVRGLFAPGEPVLLVGYEKDDSSAYLRWFPDWPRLVLPELEGGVSATTLRRLYFTVGPDVPELGQHLPPAVLRWLEEWSQTPEYLRLMLEYQAVELLTDSRAALAAQFGAPSPAPRREQLWLWLAGGQVYLRQRPGPIGEGLWELPGEPLPAATEGTGTLYSGGGRTLTGETLSWVEQGTPPAGLQADLAAVPLSDALAEPRRFYADHGVIVQRLLGQSAKRSVG